MNLDQARRIVIPLRATSEEAKLLHNAKLLILGAQAKVKIQWTFPDGL
jgi:hypothetical protein